MLDAIGSAGVGRFGGKDSRVGSLARSGCDDPINMSRCSNDAGLIQILPSGDLFEAVPSGHRFNLVIFNAPWVVSRARNRAELAIHDEDQRVLRRFFDEVPQYLKSDGRILLGYADASGPKAIENLEKIISNAGFGVESRQTKRVATHRAKRKWEHVMVYGLLG